MLRYEACIRQKVVNLLKSLGNDLVKELVASGVDTTRTAWQRARMAKLIDLAEQKINAIYGDIDKLVTDDLKGLVEVSSDRIRLAMNDAIGADLLQPLNWTDEQLRTLVGDTWIDGAPSGEWWSRQARAVRDSFADQMRKGMAQGETITELRNRIIGKTDLRKVRDPDQRAVIKTARRNAEAQIRTSAITMTNEARKAFYAANDDIIDGLEWNATLDQRTCIRCGSLDGKVYDMGDPHPSPAIHWNCRCVLLPKTKTWEELARAAGGDTKLARELDKIDPGLRASMGGPVGADVTFEGWLKRQSEATQRSILGDGKWAIWKKQRLSLEDLLDQSGNELTLEQLRNL